MPSDTPATSSEPITPCDWARKVFTGITFKDEQYAALALEVAGMHIERAMAAARRQAERERDEAVEMSAINKHGCDTFMEQNNEMRELCAVLTAALEATKNEAASLRFFAQGVLDHSAQNIVFKPHELASAARLALAVKP